MLQSVFQTLGQGLADGDTGVKYDLFHCLNLYNKSFTEGHPAIGRQRAVHLAETFFFVIIKCAALSTLSLPSGTSEMNMHFLTQPYALMQAPA